MPAARGDSNRLVAIALLGRLNEVWPRSYPCLDATDGSPDHGLEGFGKKAGVLPGQTRPHRFRMEGDGIPYTRDNRRFIEQPAQ